ncbi:MAG TPA: hypothetical protein DD407_09170, partial [Pseudohongiella sp.]|nr:hypothetical protein [Pseudohongiella sp.]
MNNNQRFVKKRLAQYVAASLIAGMSTQALANDFTINNGQLTISNDNSFSQTVTVGANGIVGSVDNVPVSNNFGIPNFSFDLVNSATTPTNGTYTFEVAVAIQSDSVSTRRFEAYLGNLTLTVNGSTVTGTIANQDLVVLARDGAVNATAVISNNSASNGAVTISGGSVTFSGSNLVNRLVNANAAFQTILNAFNAGGSYTYTVAIEQTTGAQATRFGRIVNGTFSPFPRVQTECSLATNSQLSNVFTLNGTVNNAPYAIRTLLSSAYAVQGKFGVQQAASSGALTAFTEDCTEQTTGGGGGNNGGGEVVVPVEQLQEQAEQLDSLAEQIANNPGNVPEAVIQQIDQATDNAVQNIGNVIARFEQGTEVNTGNLLATLEVAAKASSTSSTASGSGTGNQSLAQKSSSLLTNSAAALTSLAAQSQSGNAPALTATQVTQVRTATTNLLSTASTLSTQSTSTTDIASAARAAAEVINANRRLNVAADAALVASVSNASAQIATAAIRAVAGANVSDAEITTLLQQNQGLAEQVLNLALPIPPSQVTTRAERNNQI